MLHLPLTLKLETDSDSRSQYRVVSTHSMTQSQASATVVRFPGARCGASLLRDQRSLMDAVYNAGSIPVSADDIATKRLAARLQILGFFDVSEVQGDGSLRRLRPSETMRAEQTRPWRIARSGAIVGMDCALPLHSIA
jgi:hypothetical protein